MEASINSGVHVVAGSRYDYNEAKLLRLRRWPQLSLRWWTRTWTVFKHVAQFFFHIIAPLYGDRGNKKR